MKPFKLDGKPLDLAPATPSLDKLIKFLAALPENEFMSRTEVMAKVGVGKCMISEAAKDNPKLAPYRLQLPNRRGYAFGNQRSIETLGEHLKSLDGGA